MALGTPNFSTGVLYCVTMEHNTEEIMKKDSSKITIVNSLELGCFNPSNESNSEIWLMIMRIRLQQKKHKICVEISIQDVVYVTALPEMKKNVFTKVS